MNILKTRCRVEDINLKNVLKDERLVKIIGVLSKDDLEIILDLESKEFYRGVCNKCSISDKYFINICVQTGLDEDIFYFNRRGLLGDVMNPYRQPVKPKNINDIGVYSIIFTILHEYKHYLQYKNGLMNNINIDVDQYNHYTTNEAQLLEDEAEDFALEHIIDIMKYCYDSLH